MVFDSSKPIAYEATVLNKRTSSGKSTHYYCDVSPWIDDSREHKEVTVSQSVYNALDSGDTMQIKLYRGWLGIPYLNYTTYLSTD